MSGSGDSGVTLMQDHASPVPEDYVSPVSPERRVGGYRQF